MGCLFFYYHGLKEIKNKRSHYDNQNIKKFNLLNIIFLQIHENRLLLPLSYPKSLTYWQHECLTGPKLSILNPLPPYIPSRFGVKIHRLRAQYCLFLVHPSLGASGCRSHRDKSVPIWCHTMSGQRNVLEDFWICTKL